MTAGAPGARFPLAPYAKAVLLFREHAHKMSYMGAVILATKKLRELNAAESAAHRAALLKACGDANVGEGLVDKDRLNRSLAAGFVESQRVYEVECAIIASAERLGRLLDGSEISALNAASYVVAYPTPEPGFWARLFGRSR